MSPALPLVAAVLLAGSPSGPDRGAEIRAIVEGVLADADTRAALLRSGATAGYDDGFFIASADERFRLNLTGQLQVRFVSSHQDAGADNAHRAGFETRRTRLWFRGHVLDPDWRYAVTLGLGRTGAGSVRNAFVERRLGDGWAIRAGQFKPPFLREELVPASVQLAADRSLVNGRFTTGRTQGLRLSRRGDRVRVFATLHDGAARTNEPWSEEDTELAVVGRAELRLGGDWDQFRDFSGRPGGAAALLLGAAASYEKDESGTPGGPEEAAVTLTLDASAEWDGASAFASVVYQDREVAGREPWAAVVQGSVFLTERWEAFARYEHGDDGSAADDLSVVTVGVNRYFRRHALKLTGQLGYAFDGVDESWAADRLGWRADAPGDDGQLVILAQLQLLF